MISARVVWKEDSNDNCGSKFADDQVFVITRNIPDMAKLIDGGVPIKAFNVGNLSEKPGTKKIKPSVAVSPDDIAIIRRLLKQGVTITAQMVPNESATSIATFIDKAEWRQS